MQPRVFVSFLLFGNPDEILSLVFEIVHKRHKSALQ